MRNLIAILILGIGLSSCTTRWEYKTVTIKGKPDDVMGKFGPNKFQVDDESLNIFGKDGWEMVGVYEKTETVTPNYGNDEYVSGLKPNVRTAEISFVFKRRK